MSCRARRSIRCLRAIFLPPRGITYSTASALIKRMIIDPPAEHKVVKETYKHISLAKDSKITSRKDSALLAQLRSGHCKRLAAYNHRLDETVSPMCRRCDEEEETVEHWIRCPAATLKRQEIFGDDTVDLGTLTKHPLRSLTLAKATLMD